MARLETQINQIYLADPAGKKTSFVLHDEDVNNSAHLYVVAELWDLKKKTEAQDLQKISEIILESFRANRKLAAEALFEASLSQINQNLADLAHEGRKSWVGKFSCVVCLKSGDNIYLANDGQAGSWLNRKGETMEVLGPEKRGTHPLKTFTNFTQGRLTGEDILVLCTANIFNYISLDHFSEMISNQSTPEACTEISSILQDSVSEKQGFASFILRFSRDPIPVQAPVVSAYAPEPELEESEVSKKSFALPKLNLNWRPDFSSLRDIRLKVPKFTWPPKMPEFRAPAFRMPAFRVPKIPAMRFKFGSFRWEFFNNLTRAGKFFFISFAVFLIIFLINLTSYLVSHGQKKTEERILALSELVSQQMTEAQSAVIYRNNDQALVLIGEAQENFNELQELSPEQAAILASRLENIKTQINKVSTVTNPQLLAELKRSPVFLGKAPSAFLFSNNDSNSLAEYGSSYREFFLLNSRDNLTGLAFMPQVGVVIASDDKLYRVNTELEQLEELVSIGGSTKILRAWGNNLMALDAQNGKIMRITQTRGTTQATSVAAVSNSSDIRDIGGDGDLWTLTSDSLTKISGGAPTSITLPNVTDDINNANKLFVASNIYILEASKKRVIILSKTGALQNQIYFPSLNEMKDFYVDEAGRSIYILEENSLYKITF